MTQNTPKTSKTPKASKKVPKTGVYFYNTQYKIFYNKKILQYTISDNT